LGKTNSIEYVREQLKLIEITLDSEEYINYTTKLKVRCKNNHSFEATYANLVYGKQLCKECKKIDIYNEAQKYLNSKGIKIIDKEYINNKTKMLVECDQGHQWRATYASLVGSGLRNTGCPYCSKRFMLTQEEAVQRLENTGNIVLEGIYTGNRSKFKLRCKNNPEHEWIANFGDVVNKKSGCPHCWSINRRGENNNWWNGGTAELNQHLREYAIEDWSNNIRESQNYTCQITGTTKGKFPVHHASESFNDIKYKILKELNLLNHKQVKDYTEEDLKNIKDKMIEYHNTSVIGETLSKPVHELFHSLYGNHNNYDQFLEFKQRYNNGEFKDILN
jgi:hypothetical protein